jgi:hypothetical protein
MKCYKFCMNKYYASFKLVNDTDEKHDTFGNKWSHYAVLHRLINFMISRGWAIEHDKDVHKIIRKDFWYGRKGDLEVYAHRYPRGFEFEFCQNIVFTNPNGGRYDFDKFDKMPYMIKLLFLNETRHMKAFLETIVPGIVDDTRIEYKLVADKIKAHYIESWHHSQKSMDEFELSDLDGQTNEYSYNHTDRDKKIIYNGQIKYFRHWNGHLMRGKVYHNINNMWWVILNAYEYTNIANFCLFDATPIDFQQRRLKAGNPPKSYYEKLEHLQKSTTKELLRELKKRGCKMAV